VHTDLKEDSENRQPNTREECKAAADGGRNWGILQDAADR
jgi:hypothetical protein